MGIHRRKEDFKKKDVMYLLSYIKEYLQRSLQLLKNKSQISLVKLVVTIISFIVSSKKGNHFLKSLLLAFANICEILSLLSELTVFPTNCGLRITVSRYPSAHIWDLRLAGWSVVHV